MRIRWLRGTVHPRRKGQIEDCAQSGITPDVVARWVKKGFCEVVHEPEAKTPEPKRVKDRPEVSTRAVRRAPKTKSE